ncbi:class I SAM-dependent methyltransferase [Gracilibacillus alcaliphilus]|uniref:class I SAM-dependent methyltransferase n=1 Tax=Gracilibacillus alcaliphilus TaxID=1401441 RepID=UPI001959402D|nr:class I SAM-dependent methyltransferase [Gracilibacillus alcaliphilus]MBM7679222.1 SAM-dependent methyltransferase [Gracilibacillus alcaliphilus]
MKQNKYDNEEFFVAYQEMPRSVKGLEAAGEWHMVKEMLPELKDKAVLDLGCGFGWHCRYAREKQAKSVIGVDISEKMIIKAQAMTDDPEIFYIKAPVEDVDFEDGQFDVVFSSLAFHYIKDFAAICQKAAAFLKPGGAFVFSVEHPIFTARAEQDWYYDQDGNMLHWPLDHYQTEGLRETSFLADNVQKYHRTVASYINEVIQAGFTIQEVQESVPSAEMLEQIPEMRDELRRPMFLMIAAEKAK